MEKVQINCQEGKKIANQAKLKLYHRTPKYKVELFVPTKYNQAIKIDERSNNHKSRYCTCLESKQLNVHKIFTDLGKGVKPPPGSKKTNAHFNDVKHDGGTK